MRTMHLFAGAGGGLLADLILGHQPVCAVEWEPSACRILRERAAEGWFPGLHVHEGDVREFDFSPWSSRVDQISAGFPCQDISAAGRGAGLAGARSGLVSEVFRGIDTIRPGLVFLENSPCIRTKGRSWIIGQLVARGYSWRDGKIAASDVGAGHQRDRWFLLAANADGRRKLEQDRSLETFRQWFGDGAQADADAMRGECETGRGQQGVEGQETRNHATHGAEETAHPVRQRLEQLRGQGIDEARQKPLADSDEAFAADRLRHRLQVAVQRGGLSATDAATIESVARYVGAYDWSPPDSGVCRVVDGLATRVDRIKCAGNGQVPIQAAAAWLCLSI